MNLAVAATICDPRVPLGWCGACDTLARVIAHPVYGQVCAACAGVESEETR